MYLLLGENFWATDRATYTFGQLLTLLPHWELPQDHWYHLKDKPMLYLHHVILYIPVNKLGAEIADVITDFVLKFKRYM